MLEVHSGTKGDEKDDIVAKLLTVEDAANPIEIVVHVNMLKEGWDVRNLYTIVPLRKADSKTLIEQSVGRGLRLPYGVRTGEERLDRLTIIAHDNFETLLDEANDPKSAVAKYFQPAVVLIDPNEVPTEYIPAPTKLDELLSGEGASTKEDSPAEKAASDALHTLFVLDAHPFGASVEESGRTSLLQAAAEKDVATLASRVGAYATADQTALPGFAGAMLKLAEKICDTYTRSVIQIPQRTLRRFLARGGRAPEWSSPPGATLEASWCDSREDVDADGRNADLEDGAGGGEVAFFEARKRCTERSESTVGARRVLGGGTNPEVEVLRCSDVSVRG